jgi:hypothetical protein
MNKSGEWETWLAVKRNVSKPAKIIDQVTGHKLNPKVESVVIRHGELEKSIDVRKPCYGYPSGENKKAVWHFVSRNSEEAPQHSIGDLTLSPRLA